MSIENLLETWPDAPITVCRGCGKKIFFAKTQDGKQIPLDVGPPVYILMKFQDAETGKWIYRCDQEKSSFVNHFTTCVKANDFSSSK